MTISTTYSPDTYNGNGSLDTFAITFQFLDTASYVKVSIKVNSTGVITTKTSGTHYNVSGSNVVFTGGNIPATGEVVIIELNPSFLQEDDYTENNRLPVNTLETNLDLLTLQSQLNDDQKERSLRVDATVDVDTVDTTVPVSANKYVKWNSAGTALEVATLSDTAGLGSIQEDPEPTLGNDLDTNAHNVSFDSGNGITDDSGNEQLMFTKVASAVNYANITNAATGNAVELEAKGGDTNVALTLKSKGAGNINLDPGTGDINVDAASLLLATNEGIKDDSGNELLMFTKVANAVNYVNITNSATGSDVKMEANGDDADVSVQVNSKGAAGIILGGTAVTVRDVTDTAAGELRIREKASNGTNYIGLKAPTSVTSNVTFTLPSADGTSGQALVTNASATLSFADIPVVATQADQETGTNIAKFVSPGRQHFHPSAAKVFVLLNGTGTPAILRSFNVSSITDLGTGNYRINLTTAMSDALYSVVGMSSHTLGSTSLMVNESATQTTTTFSIFVLNAAGTAQDRDYLSVAVFGDM